jgi:hypothetical protein
MDKTNPSKFIRKSIFTAINGMVVNGLTIPCYDTRVKPSENPHFYVLMTTQSKRVLKQNKCEYFWEADILLDIVTIYNGSGNTGSRLLVDDIENQIRSLTQDLVIEGFTTIIQTEDFPNNLDNINDNQIVYRNFIRYTLTLN